MLYKNKIKRKTVISKFKHKLAWDFLLLKATFRYLLHFNDYIPLTIKHEIHYMLTNYGDFSLSIKPHSTCNSLKDYLDGQHYDNDKLWKMFKHLSRYIESKFDKYKDVKITYDHYNTYDNVIINIKLI